jgi:hypothetical protein
MKTTLFAIATLIMGNVALAIPVPSPTVVHPHEGMVTIPGLEFLGASRISSVRYCVTSTGVRDWRNLLTDSELESMHRCLSDLT